MPPKKKLPENELFAIYVSGPIYDRNLGRLEKGYHIVSEHLMNRWIECSDKVRRATYEEVLSKYEDLK